MCTTHMQGLEAATGWRWTPLELKEQRVVSGCGGTNLGPLREQPELMMTEPWLQLLGFHSFNSSLSQESCFCCFACQCLWTGDTSTPKEGRSLRPGPWSFRPRYWRSASAEVDLLPCLLFFLFCFVFDFLMFKNKFNLKWNLYLIKANH